MKTAEPDRDERLADLADELARRLAAGDEQAAERFLTENPNEASELRALLPAAKLMANIGHSALDFSGVASSHSSEPEHLGRELGDFRLVREIGRGGMGVVYEAEQISLGRRVALKILPYASVLDERALQRFRNEARAAAGLEHPHIVAVYATGCERGVHYLAMRYIDGLPLSEVIRRAQTEAGLSDEDAGAKGARGSSSFDSQATILDPRVSHTSPPAAETLPVAALSTERPRDASRYRTAAKLIRQAAEALEYAHSVGVVHRDVKPSNLLLDSKGNAWVADFGLAHLEGDSSLTMTGDVMGTLRYMSPEQATGRRGLVDHRSDVYSLGLTLYELLTLRAAFPQQSRTELMKAVIFGEPLRPRKLEPWLPRDLETIVLKATEKDPPRRYQTAGALAEDLRRFISGEPVLAKRAGLADRSTKWVNRHRGLTASAAAILTVVAVASSLSTAEISAAYAEETRHRKDAEVAAGREREATAREKEAAAKAKSNYDLAREAVARMLTHVGAEHLARVPEFSPIRTQVLQEALAFCDALIDANPSDAAVYLERARTRHLLGDYAGELSDRRKALELDPRNPSRHIALSRFFECVPDVAFRDYGKAVEHGRISVELDPGNAASHEVLGRALKRVGRVADSVEQLKIAAEIEPDSGVRHRNLAEAYLATGDADAALTSIREAIRLEPDLPSAHGTHGEILSRLGRFEDALTAVNESIRLHGKSLDITYCWNLERRGKVLAALGRDEEAIADWDLAAELAPFRCYPFKWRAAAKFRLGRYAEALADFDHALKLFPQDSSALLLIPPDQVRDCPDGAFRKGMLRLADAMVARNDATPVAWRNVSQVRAELLGPTAARDGFAKAIAGGDDDFYAHYQHAVTCAADGDLPACRAAVRRILERFGNEAKPDVALFTAWTAALVPDALGDYGPALTLARKAVEAKPQDLDAAKTLGAVLYRAGRFTEAAETFAATERLTDSGGVSAASIGFLLAMTQHRLGNVERARASFERAVAWADETLADRQRLAAANVTWERRATLALLRAEAESVVRPVEAQRGPPNSSSDSTPER